MKRPNLNVNIPLVCTMSDYTDIYVNNGNLRPDSPYKRYGRVYAKILARHIPRRPNWLPFKTVAPCPDVIGRSMYNDLLARCKSSVIDKIDGIMMTRDLKHAAEGTYSFFRRIPSAVRALRRGRFREAAHRLGCKGYKTIPNTYLGYTYGVAPLVADVAKLWDFATKPNPPIFQVVSSAQKKEFGSERIGLTVENTPIYAKASTEAQYSVRMVRQFTSDAFLELKGMDLNPIPTIWDAIPWSFVIDWFVPIGAALQQLTFRAPTCCNGYNSLRGKASTSITFPLGTISSDRFGRYWEYKLGLSTSTEFFFQREMDRSLTWSSAEALGAFMSGPTFGFRRLLNAFALASQALMR